MIQLQVRKHALLGGVPVSSKYERDQAAFSQLSLRVQLLSSHLLDSTSGQPQPHLIPTTNTMPQPSTPPHSPVEPSLSSPRHLKRARIAQRSPCPPPTRPWRQSGAPLYTSESKLLNSPGANSDKENAMPPKPRRAPLREAVGYLTCNNDPDADDESDASTFILALSPDPTFAIDSNQESAQSPARDPIDTAIDCTMDWRADCTGTNQNHADHGIIETVEVSSSSPSRCYTNSSDAIRMNETSSSSPNQSASNSTVQKNTPSSEKVSTTTATASSNAWSVSQFTRRCGNNVPDDGDDSDDPDKAEKKKCPSSPQSPKRKRTPDKEDDKNESDDPDRFKKKKTTSNCQSPERQRTPHDHGPDLVAKGTGEEEDHNTVTAPSRANAVPSKSKATAAAKSAPKKRAPAKKATRADPAPSNRPTRDRKAPERFSDAKETKPVPHQSTKKAPVKKSGGKVFDPVYITTNANSRLAKADVFHMLVEPAAWTSLSNEQQLKLISMLPQTKANDDHLEYIRATNGHCSSADTRPDAFTLSNDNFRTDVAKFQADLRNGHLGKTWQASAEQAVIDRAAGVFDAFKAEEFELWWGQKSTAKY
ncbi:hypothetical protein ACEQ8H_000567 [Pleosporales sp. CAS-2024a]